MVASLFAVSGSLWGVCSLSYLDRCCCASHLQDQGQVCHASKIFEVSVKLREVVRLKYPIHFGMLLLGPVRLDFK
jgi:hypothetical protein